MPKDRSELEVGVILPWAAVSEIHRSRNGIYQRKGRLVSLLTDLGRLNPCYPDFHGLTEETIHYTGSGRRGNQKLDAANSAMLDAIETGHSAFLVNKLSANNWQFLGSWRVAHGQHVFEESHHRMVWKFTLEKMQVEDC